MLNDLLLNSDLLEQLKNKSDNEIENLVQEYLLTQVEKVQEELTEEQTKTAISNMPELLYNHRAINRVIFWKKNRSSNLDELLQQHDATDELIDVLIILKSISPERIQGISPS